MCKVISFNKNVEETKEEILHPFHLQLIENCGVVYADFRSFLDNLNDDQILEEIDVYVKSQINS